MILATILGCHLQTFLTRVFKWNDILVLCNWHLKWKMGVGVLFGCSTPCLNFTYLYIFLLNISHKSLKKKKKKKKICDGSLCSKKLANFWYGYIKKESSYEMIILLYNYRHLTVFNVFLYSWQYRVVIRSRQAAKIATYFSFYHV